MAKRQVPPSRRRRGVSFQVEELEPRLLFSADAATMLGLPVSMAAPAQSAPAPAPAPETADAPSASVPVMQAVVAAPTPPEAEKVRHELVFVDASVPEADKLVAGIQADSTPEKVIEVVVIQAGEDGLAVITQTLKDRHDLYAVHIISHGDGASIQIGTTKLDATTLNDRLGDISSWGAALTADADLLLYGCDLTSTDQGRALADNLALLTGADVAASSDLTGATALGGNWVLEYQHGQIESNVVVDSALAASWNHVLATTVSFQDGVGGYTGTTDTFLELLGPTNNNSASTTLSAGRATTQNGFQTLIKFEDIVGTGTGQIPPGSVVTSVTFSIYMTASPTFTNPTFSFYRMLAGWTDTSTYSSMGSGVDGSEYMSTADFTLTDNGVNTYTFTFSTAGNAVLNTVQAWVNDPSSNQGWYLFCDDNSSKASFASSEYATVANRPKLSVTYTAPAPPSVDLDANNSSGATGSDFKAGFVEQTPIKIADTDATITGGVNPVSTNLSGLKVTLTNPLDGALESLSATTTGTNITASYNSGTGVLQLSGNDTVANYQTVLRSITYNNTSDNPTTTSRVITVVASDPYGGAGPTATTTLSVTRVNDAPVITSNGGGATAAISVKETLTAVTTVTATDVDSTTLTYSISGGADASKFTINSTTGVLTFVAAPDFENPTDVGANNVYDVTVQVSDGALVDTQAIAVTVLDVPSTLTVTTIADTNDVGLGTSFTAEQLNARGGGTDGKVSLREAIIAANTQAGLDTINFAITGTAGTYGEFTITLTATLPSITDAVYINAASQTGYTNRPLIVLDGNGGNGDGLYLSNTADGSTIRGLVIRAFSANGIYVQAGSDGNTIVGNYIGSFNADGSNAGSTKRNASEGIESYGANLTIGGTTALDRNVISGNASAYNIYLATGSDGTVIKGNYIGTNSAGSAAFSSTNSNYGVMIENSATNVTIGGTATGAGNVISGFTTRGIWATTTGTVTIQGNYVGTDATGTADLGNGEYGIYVDDGGSVVIGGTATGAGNLVSGNDGGGIYLGNSGTATVQGNIVGLNAAGTAKLANTGVGIYLNTGTSSTIGGSTTSARNIVSGNTSHGIQVVSSPTGGQFIKGNYIGVGADGTTLLGNGGAGVYIATSNVIVGGKNAGDGNVIAGNGGAGIAVASGTGSLFYRNSIYSNTGLGIDLNNDGVTLNDYNDGDGGANWSNNFPVITSVVTSNGTTTIQGSIEWYNQSQPIYIEFFSSPSKDPSGYGEGKTYVGYAQVTTDATTGDATFSLTVTGVSVGDWITAVANVEGGPMGASEFAMAVQAVAPANAPRGKLIWNVNDQTYQKYADWGPGGWSGVGTDGLNLTDDISMILAAESPTRNEIIFVGSADASGKILAAIWNGTTWSSVLTLPLASPAAAASQYDSFAIAYDSLTGNAMLVWDNGNTGTAGLSYATWNGTSWSSISTIAAPVSGEPQHMKLVANPTTHEMVLAVSTTAASNNQYAVVWSGTSWGNAQTLGTNSNQQMFEMNVAYEQVSGRAMVVYDNSSSDSSSVQYRVWNGTSWSAEATIAAASGVTVTSDVYSTVVASDAKSNRIAIAVQDAADEVWLSVWDGSSWGSSVLATATGTDMTEHHSGMAVAFESQSGDLLAAYGKQATAGTFYRTWTSGGGWSSEQAGPSLGGADPQVIKLYSDPYTNTIMMGVQDDQQDLNLVAWDGSAWGAVTEMDTATGQTYRENFTYVWYQTSPSIANLAGDTLAYTEKQAATVIDQGTAASAVANGNYSYNGGNLTVSFASGGVGAEDVLAVRNQGTGAGQIGVSGSNITYAGTVIGTVSGGTGGAGLVITLNGNATDAAVSALINNVTYQNTNTTNPASTNRTVRFVLTNEAGQSSLNNDVTVSVTAVNDAPVNTVPGAQTTNEDTAIVFSSGNGNLISIGDVDAGSGSLQVTLSVLNGTLTLSRTTGLSFTTGTGTGNATMVFTGTLANINAALAGLTYNPTANYNGSDTLTITTSDQGNTGSGGTKTDTDTVAITVSAVNDAPVNSVPAAQATNEDTALVFSSANSNLISISDVDAGSGSLQVTLSVLHGTLTLSRTTGLSFTTGSGTGNATMVFTGTLANINAALAGLTYNPTANYNGAETLTLTTSDQGNTGSGGAKTDTDTVAITVNAVNDAPVNTVPGAQTTNEDTAIVFSSGNGNLISISDVDAGSASLQVTLSVLNGTLTLSRTTGLSFTTGTGTGNATMVFTGTLANINAALAGLTYNPTANYNGAETLTITTSDQGNTGSGGTLTDTDTVAITVNAVNDAPVNNVPAAQTVNEDTALVFSSANGNLISITDVDAASGAMKVTLSVVNGTLTLSRTTGLSFITGSGTANATMVFTGTLANINAALAGLTYNPTANYNGSETLTITTSDQGNTGSGGTLSDTDTVAITVSAVNDAPVNTVPAAQSTNEDTALVFSSANSNLISISDVDAGSASLQVTLSVLNGTLTLSRTTGLSFTTGTGTGNATMVFTGTLANINAALAGLTYTPTANYNGAETLTITTSDQGNTGSGGAKTDTDTVAITVNAVNDAPVNTVPAAQSVNEDTALVFSSGNGNLISISDVDAASGAMKVTLSVLNGTLTLSGIAGLSFTTGTGTANATMVFTGTLANINAALAGLTYNPTANYNGSETLTITTSDQGNTGTGGTKTDTDTVAITVNAVNDAPVNTVPPAQTTNEDTALVFSSGNGNLISIGDVDAGSGSLQVTLSVANGTLTLSRTTGLSFTTGTGTGNATMVFTGTLANINAALAGLTYTPTANYNGAETLTITTSDQGNTGSGGAKTDTDTVAITVTAVNDAPTATITQPSYSATEQVALNLHGTGLSIADVDAGSSLVQATLSVISGRLTVAAGSTGVTVGGSGTTTVTLTGTLAQINALLAGSGGATATYLQNSDTPPASDTLTLSVNDQGNTGSGGAKSGSANVAINITAVNDAPVANITQPSYTATYQTSLTLSGTGIGIGDVDAGSATVQATLNVTLGMLTVVAGSTGVSVSGSGTDTVTLTGTLAQINSLLSGAASGSVKFVNNSGSPLASSTLTLSVNDLGNSGSGGAKTASNSVSIDVLQTAPVDTMIVPGVQQSDIDAFYAFNASGNLGRDDSGHGHSLTLTGSTGQTADNGGLQSALGLTGGAGEILGLPTGGALTVAGWVRFDSTGNGESMIDFGDANNSGIGNIVIGRVGSTGDLQFLIDTPGNPQSITATGAIVDGQWMHVAATVDASGVMSLYVNGALVGTAQGTAPAAGVRSHNYVGQSNTAGNSQLDGAVDDLLIANKALTADQIAAIYDQSQGLTVPEHSANGTLVGTVLDSSAIGANTVSYSLVNSAGGRFAIDATTGVITVADGSQLRYDQAQSHTITVRATDSGGEALDTSYVVHLSDRNQAPQGADKTIGATEDTAYTFTTADFGFSDNADSPANSLLAVKIDSLPTSGSLTLNGVAVNAGDFVSASDIAAGKLQFIADANDNGTGYATIGFQVQDDGGTANGGTDLDPVTRTLTIDVAAVNDAPVAVIVPPTYSATEQTLLDLHGTGLSLSDVDAGGATVQATLSVVSGTLNVNAGSTGVVVAGSTTGTVTLTGTLAQINDLLAGNGGATVGYLIDTDTPPASDTLTLAVNDLGNTGSGGARTASDSATINIIAVNDAPVNHVPGAQTVDEDTPLVFSSGNGNLISLSDADAGSGNLQVTLSVLHGTLSLSGIAGLSFTTGDGSADGTMVFTGTLASINAALAGLVYTPTGNYNGAETLSLTTSDLGNTGTGGAQQAVSTVAIEVDAVNDAPVNTVPPAQATNEDTPLVFSSANGNLIAIGDVDAGNALMQVSLSVAHGSLTLSGIAGLTFVGGDGTADAAMVFRGTVADINAALAGLVYTPNGNYNGTETLSLTTSDLGNTGTGGTLVDTDTVTIAVNAVNDAPVNTVPDAQSTDEDTALVFSSANGNLISINDVDAASGAMQVTLSALHGSLTLSGTTGLSFTTGDGHADHSMVFTGTLANINAALNGLIYTPDTDYHGADTLTLLTSDQGNTGSGGTLTATSTVAINIDSVNDAPVNGVPGAQSVNEDTALVFSSGNGNLISVSDADAGSLQVTLSVTNGTLSLSGLTGLTFTQGDGTGDASMVFTGSIADINAALAGLAYTPTGNYNGAATLSITTSDLGQSGAGGVMTDSDTVAITVNAVNDTPVNTVPGAQSLNEDGSLVFSAGNGNAISVSDVDAGSGNVQVTLSVAHGTLSLSGLTGLSFTTGDGAADATMVFSGSIADINAALAGLVYTPTADHNGADTLTLITSDLGNTGSGGVQTATSTVAITVNAVNDAPVNTVPSAQSVNEDTPLVFSAGNGNAISIGDVDAGSGNLQVTLSVGQGTLSLSGIAGLTFITGDGTGDGSMSFTGSLSAINAALAGLVYTPTANVNGADTLTIFTSDLGNTGAGGVLTATNTVAITVNAVNDAPVNTVPGAQSVNEDTALVFSSSQGNLISINDVDAGSGNLQVTLSVLHGSLSLSGLAGLTFTTGDGTGDATMTFSGSLSAINAALAGLVYTPVGDYNGADTLTLSTSDLGNTGAGGAQTDTDTVAINVQPVNDAPTGNVTITGTPTQGQTLNASNTLADADGLGAITYHWLRDGVDTGGTGTSYLLTQADVGVLMSVRAVYTDGGGTVESVNSAQTAAVANVNDAPSGSVAIGGTPTQGQTLTASNTLTDPDGMGTVSYHWLRDGVDTGSTGGSYVLTQADVGRLISVRASYVDGGGTAESALSASVGPVADINVAPTLGSADLLVGASPSINLPSSFLLADAQDEDGDPLTVMLIGSVSHGQLTQLSDGSWQYRAADGFVGTDTFTYAVSDGQLQSTARTVRITVTDATVVTPPTTGPVTPTNPVNPSQPGSGTGSGGTGTSPTGPSNPVNPPTPPTTTPPVTTPPTTTPPVDAGDGSNGNGTGTGSGTKPGSGGQNGNASGGGQASGRGPSSSYSASNQAYAMNQAGGFVFRLEAGGMQMGINTSNLLVKMMEGVGMAKGGLDQNLNLSFSQIGVHGSSHASPTLAFAETTEDRQVKVEKMVVQTSGAALSIGAVWWAARMSGLLASLAISTPAWRSIDPLPVMGLGGDGPDDEDEHGDDPDGMDERAARLFGGNAAQGRELEGIG